MEWGEKNKKQETELIILHDEERDGRSRYPSIASVCCQILLYSMYLVVICCFCEFRRVHVFCQASPAFCFVVFLASEASSSHGAFSSPLLLLFFLNAI